MLCNAIAEEEVEIAPLPPRFSTLPATPVKGPILNEVPDGVRPLMSNVAPEALKSIALKIYPDETPLIANVPPLTVVVPERLIPPVAVNVPALILVKLPLLPEIAPELVRSNVFVSTVSVSPLPIDMARPMPDIVAASCNVEFPDTVIPVPLSPNAASALMLIVPALKVVPPVYVLVPVTVMTPEPDCVSVPPVPVTVLFNAVAEEEVEIAPLPPRLSVLPVTPVNAPILNDVPDGVSPLISNVAPEPLKSMVLKLYPEEAPLRTSVPALTVVVPERLIPPVAVNVPALILVKLPLLPEMAPEFVKLKLFVSTVSVSPLPIEMAPPHARYRCSELQRRIPRDTVIPVPLSPNAASALMLSVPALKVRSTRIRIGSGHCHDASARLGEFPSGSRHSAI